MRRICAEFTKMMCRIHENDAQNLQVMCTEFSFLAQNSENPTYCRLSHSMLLLL